MKTVRITSKTVEDAIEEGLKQLGISREEAVVHVVEQPSSGLFGLIRKKDAVVDISAKETEASDVDGEPVSTDFPADEEKRYEEESETEDIEEEADRENHKKHTAEELPFVEEDQAVVAEEAKKFLTGVFASMNLDVQMEKMMNEERILFNLHGDGLGILIGKHGQTLDALQYLTNLAAGKNFRRRYFVLLDVEGYRERRRQTLESLAHRLAGKVKRTGEEVKLEPMPAGERRIIHLALQHDYAVTTDSEGETPYRCVVIRPKN